MTALKVVFLVFLVGFTTAHLISSWKDDEKRRKFSKPFIVPCIVAYYFLSAETVCWPLVAGLIASWLGDILLIPKGHKWFALGGVAFFATHVFFVMTYYPYIDFACVNWYVTIPVACLYLAADIFLTVHFRKSTPAVLRPPMSMYIMANGTMNVFALMMYMTLRNQPALIVYIGAVLFFISDFSCFSVRYSDLRDYIPKKHFTVMLTYTVAVFMITQGLLLL
ncbi:MAG: lysoplasmalogenase [Treponema sp.]|nr:lysoplasmalogenase [Candidatus Treponema caballi]